MRTTLICSGGSEVFLRDGQVRYSTTEHGFLQAPDRRVLRDLRGGATATIELDDTPTRARITFADATVWTLIPMDRHHWLAELDDGSLDATLTLDAAQRLEVHADGRVLATGVPQIAQVFRDQQWSIDAADDVDAWWLAATLTALVACALRDALVQ
jgi:hypothetical protein